MTSAICQGKFSTLFAVFSALGVFAGAVADPTPENGVSGVRTGLVSAAEGKTTLFVFNPTLPFIVGTDSTGRTRFGGSIADLQVMFGDKTFHRGPAKAGDRLVLRPTEEDVQRPFRFSCRFTTSNAAASQRLLDNLNPGVGNGVLVDLYTGRLRLHLGGTMDGLFHPQPIPSGREVSVAVELTADDDVVMTVDGDRRVVWRGKADRPPYEGRDQRRPDPDTLLALDAPIGRWEDALPLGNGVAGALVWGGGNALRITLDRADYWHNTITASSLRPDYTFRTVIDMVNRGDEKLRRELFEDSRGSPTKLPGVRLTLTLGEGQTIRRFRLDRPNGAAHVSVATPAGVREILCWFDDGDDCLSLRVPEGVSIAKREFNRNSSFDKLGGYPEPVVRIDDGGAFYSRGHRRGATGRFDRDFKTGVRFVKGSAAPNSAFWNRFNACSAVSIPDASMQRLYDFAIYLYGAAARRGCAPIALQGLWTADNGSLPPWRGDYHNNMNTEMTYWAAGPAGCIEALEGFADFYLQRIDVFRRYGRKVLESADGAMITPTMGFTGDVIRAGPAWMVMPEHGIWAYCTLTDAFDYAPTREKATRYLTFGRELAALNEHAWTVRGGVRVLRISSSPEIEDGWNRLFFTNTSYARAILNGFYARLARLAEYVGEREEAAKWRAYVGTFGTASARDGVLEIAKGRLLNYSHRHPSHLMDVFPFFDTPRDSEVDPVKSVDQYVGLGFSRFVGFSFSWLGCLEARLGRGDRAWNYLRDFDVAFTSRSGFNLNGDQARCGLSTWHYRPFTLDANFGFARGIQEMLLQYDPHANEVRLFPALPHHWNGREVSFRDLRVPGGHRISAVRAADGTITVKLTPYPGSPVPRVVF